MSPYLSEGAFTLLFLLIFSSYTTLSSNQCVLCGRYPKNILWSPGWRCLEVPGGASPVQSNLTQEICFWLNLFNHFHSIFHQQSMPQSSTVVPIPRKHPSQVWTRKPGQATFYCVGPILRKLLSPWHGKCQHAGSLLLSCLSDLPLFSSSHFPCSDWHRSIRVS